MQFDLNQSPAKDGGPLIPKLEPTIGSETVDIRERSSTPSALAAAAGAPTESAPSTPDAAKFSLDRAEPLDPKSFPHPPAKGGSVPTTIANTAHLLASHDITPSYNVINKKLVVTIPGQAGTVDNADNVAIAQITSLAALNGMAIGQIPAFVEVIGDRNQINPVADWISSKPWDGMDRLEDFYATLMHQDDFPGSLKKILIYRWLISAVAAVMLPSGFRCRGVLTVQGPQSIGKTAWVIALVPDAVLREAVIKVDHHLDSSNKDSVITAITHWIVEIGELDSSFKKDIARLKGFLTADQDKIRRPYAKANAEYPRRTVFTATVNDEQFLPDMTGNTRFWTIPVTSVNYCHGIDMQQLWAQVAVAFQKGEQWWLTREEEQQLEAMNRNHRVISVVRDRVLSALDLNRIGESDLEAMTPTDLLREIGFQNPSNPQAKECGAVLREVLGLPKKINGQYRWRIPFAKGKFDL